MDKRTASRSLGVIALLAVFATAGSAADHVTAWNPTAKVQAEAAPNPHVREIIVVCKTIMTSATSCRVKDLLRYYRTAMIDRALEIMDNPANLPPEQQFAWTAPGWVMTKVLEDWPGQTPQRKRRLEAALKSGKFVIHALPFTVQSDFMEPEEFARSFQFSSVAGPQVRAAAAARGEDDRRAVARTGAGHRLGASGSKVHAHRLQLADRLHEIPAAVLVGRARRFAGT